MIQEENLFYDEDSLVDEEKLEIVRQLRLIDDTFFAVCFEQDIELTELILRIILEKDDLEVTYVKTQHAIRGLGGHSALLDALAKDSSGKTYNIEVQRSNQGAIPQRARYYGSLIDSQSLREGEEYKDLHETYVIFITEHDVMKGNLPIYHVDRMVRETGQPFCDGSCIIYVNASFIDDTPLGRLMQDFLCSDPRRMNYDLLSRKSSYFKETETGVKKMCKLVQDYADKQNIALIAKIAEAETKAQAAETKAQAAETKAQAAETKAQAAETKAQAAQAEAQAAETKAQAAQAEVQAAEASRKKMVQSISSKGFSPEQIAELVDLPCETVRAMIEAG